MDKKNKVIGLIAIGIFILSGIVLGRVYFSSADGFLNRSDDQGDIGAVASPYFASQDFSFGGVVLTGISGAMKNGTTTPCSIKIPPGRQRLVSFTANFSTGTTSLVWVLATSTQPNATTTPLYLRTMAGNGVITWTPSASTTNAGGVEDGIMRSMPYATSSFQYLNLGVQNAIVKSAGGGGVVGTATHPIVGTCKAIFEAIE
jgi:hypothetical protein